MSEFSIQIAVGVVVFIITSLITIPGTIAVMRRSELSKRIDRLIEEIDLFGELGVEYWETNAAPQCSGMERRIKRQSKKVGSELSRLNSEFHGFRFQHWKALTHLRQAIMRAPFEVQGRPSETHRQGEIVDEVENLKTEIRFAQKWL